MSDSIPPSGYMNSDYVWVTPDYVLKFNLRRILAKIVEHDQDYDVRYGLILRALNFAHSLGYAVGFRIDESNPAWPVAYIELPTGQVSWHMPQHINPWDHHSTEEKFSRIREYLAQD